MDKIFIKAEDILLDSFRLAAKIYQSGFRPDFIVGLWRGGSPIGIAVQDCLDFLDIKTDHISLRTSYRGLSSYKSMVEQHEKIRVHGTQYLLEKLESEHKLLIVDDVYTSGRSVQAVINRLQNTTRRNMPAEVKIAVPWYKPDACRVGRSPDFYIHQTDQWLVLPYELDGLSETEIAEHKPYVHRLLKKYNLEGLKAEGGSGG